MLPVGILKHREIKSMIPKSLQSGAGSSPLLHQSVKKNIRRKIMKCKLFLKAKDCPLFSLFLMVVNIYMT